MDLRSLFAAVATVLIAPSLAMAQAPAIVPTEPPWDVRINVWSSGDWRGGADLLRRAAPDGDMSRWIDVADPLVIAMRAEVGPARVVTALLSVSADGRATGCALAPLPADVPEQTAAGLCDRLKPRARYRPALTLDGDPTSDTVRFVVRSGGYPRAIAATMPVVRAEPLPPSPPAPFLGPGWPPLVGLPPARLAGGLPLLKGGGDAPEAAASPWAGLEVQLNAAGAPTACRAIDSSGDGRFDQEACTTARRATYTLNGASADRDRRVYMLIVRQEGELRALPQSRSGRTPPMISVEAAQTLAAEWNGQGRWPRVYVSVDAKGAVVDCRINETSGADALDIEACRMMRRTTGLRPARDVLDRPTLGSLFIERLTRDQ